jgi:16S rRNA (guanine966-N2)-methyltransferase
LASPRIISGSARGMRLFPVPGDSTRPITDRVKESLFNIIGPDIQEASLLDLFGGTGSVGIEALSRGASFVRIIDNNRNAIKTLYRNLEHTRLKANAEVIFSDSYIFLKNKPDRSFDYIYIAPPQYKELWKKALLLVDENDAWLAIDGWIVVQIDPIEYERVDLKKMREFSQRRYGNTLLIFFERAGDDPER